MLLGPIGILIAALMPTIPNPPADTTEPAGSGFPLSAPLLARIKPLTPED
jgi:hypothetical protein